MFVFLTCVHSLSISGLTYTLAFNLYDLLIVNDKFAIFIFPG